MSSTSSSDTSAIELKEKKRPMEVNEDARIEGRIFIFGVVRLNPRAIMTHLVPIEKGTASWRTKKTVKAKELERLRKMISGNTFEEKVKSKQVSEGP